MRTFAILLLGFLVFSACKKNKDIVYTIRGTVTDASFAHPGEGFNVYLYETPASGDEILSQTAVTDASGNYSFEVKRDKIENFRLRFFKENYFEDERSFTLENLDTKNDNVYNVSLTAKAWVRLIFHTPDPSTAIIVNRNEGLTGCAECCSYNQLTIGGTTDTSFICLNEGNHVYSYKWLYYGSTIQMDQSVITAPLDTTDLILNY
jgi:hypothetical protein